MKTGMLWFDNSPKTALSEKVFEAVAYYIKKYGQRPNMCLVNPVMLPEGQIQIDGIMVLPWRTITPGHLWIGEENDGTDQPAL